MVGRLKFKSFSEREVSRETETENIWIKYDYDGRIFYMECLEGWWEK